VHLLVHRTANSGVADALPSGRRRRLGHRKPPLNHHTDDEQNGSGDPLLQGFVVSEHSRSQVDNCRDRHRTECAGGALRSRTHSLLPKKPTKSTPATDYCRMFLQPPPNRRESRACGSLQPQRNHLTGVGGRDQGNWVTVVHNGERHCQTNRRHRALGRRRRSQRPAAHAGVIGLPVVAGLVAVTVFGNVLIQARVHAIIQARHDLRALIARAQPLRRFTPPDPQAALV
jgi:hypothetical protein